MCSQKRTKARAFCAILNKSQECSQDTSLVHESQNLHFHLQLCKRNAPVRKIERHFEKSYIKIVISILLIHLTLLGYPWLLFVFLFVSTQTRVSDHKRVSFLHLKFLNFFFCIDFETCFRFFYLSKSNIINMIQMILALSVFAQKVLGQLKDIIEIRRMANTIYFKLHLFF